MTQDYNVSVSMNQAAVVKTGLVLKQGDFGFNLIITVLDFDTSSTTPQIVFRKPMGAVESTTITVSSNKYTYTFKGTELDTPGKVFCDLKLKNSTTQRISTASFMFRVIADTMDGFNEQASSYSDTIEQIASGLENEINAYNKVLEIQTGTKTLNEFVSGKYINTGVSVGDTVDTTPIANGAYEYIISECNPGDAILINGYGGIGPRLWAFLDTDNKLLSVSPQSLQGEDLVVYAPQTAKYIVINSRTGYTGYCSIGYLNDRIDNIEGNEEQLGATLDKTSKILNKRTLTNNTFKFYEPILSRVVNPSLVPNESLGYHIIISVTTGDVLNVSGYVYDPVSYPLMVLVNDSVPVGTAGEASTGAKQNYVYIVPEGVDTIYINGSVNSGASGTPSASKIIDTIGYTKEVNEKFNIDTSTYINKTGTSEAGVVSTTLTLNSGIGTHSVISVEENQKYIISGFCYGSSYPLLVFAKDGVTAGYTGNETTGAYSNFEVTIPKGVNQLYINSNGSPDIFTGGISALLVVKEEINKYLNKPEFWENVDLTLVHGNIGSYGTFQDVRGIYTTINVSGNEIFRIRTYETLYPTILAYNGDAIIDRKRYSGTQWTWIQSLIYQVPENATKIIVNGQNGIDIFKLSNYNTSIQKDFSKAENNWQGKSAVWFGTSIPAAGYKGDSHVSYPGYVGDLLNMSVTNEAVGTSCVHCKKPDRVSENNPYGFIGDFEMASRCLTNTTEEMQWIIDHYDSDIWTSGTVAEMTTALANDILSFSYEQKLDKYLESGKEPDVFIFDHGNNDAFNSIEIENSYYDQYGEYSLYTYRGAMNFLIQRILNYDPYARILMIGQFCGSDADKIPTMQLQVSNDWNIPICKQWELLGWSKTKQIVCKGHWETFYSGAYIWVDDPTESNQMTVFARWVPDGLHPHTDVSGKALRHMADIIARWMVNQ